MQRIVEPAGFSLAEALIAAFIAATAIAAFAHLVALGTEQTLSARRTATARALAQSRLEELRAGAWTYDAAGARISSGALASSPDTALFEDTIGSADGLDRDGAPVEQEVPHFRRRWRTSLFDPGDPDTLLLEACVLTIRGDRPDACVWTVRTRRP